MKEVIPFTECLECLLHYRAISRSRESDMPIKMIHSHPSAHAQAELQLYPHPDTASMTLFCTAPLDFNGKNVAIRIYAMRGDLIWAAEEPMGPGLNKFVWDGVDNNGRSVGNGEYIIRVFMGNKRFEQLCKLTGNNFIID